MIPLGPRWLNRATCAKFRRLRPTKGSRSHPESKLFTQHGAIDRLPGGAIVANREKGSLNFVFADVDDPYAYDDVVFGAVGSLLRKFEPDGAGAFHLDVELRLEPGTTHVPNAPLP